MLNKKNQHELKQNLLHCDNKLIQTLTNKQISYIKNKLNSIKNSISQEDNNNNTKENDFFICLYNGLNCVYSIIIFQKEINEHKDIINKEEMKINELQNEIEHLQTKINFYKNLKTKIEHKYETNQQLNKQNYELKYHTISSFPVTKSKPNSSNNITKPITNTDENTHITTRKNSSNKMFSPNTTHALPHSHPSSSISAKNDLNEIKLLINKMETNYIHLLKDLSKTIIKPKNLINKPDIAFLQSKIN
jgi:hypothetical protein